jgi:hypothetical protein
MIDRNQNKFPDLTTVNGNDKPGLICQTLVYKLYNHKLEVSLFTNMSRRALKRAIDSALNTRSGGGCSGSSGSSGSGGNGGSGVACGDVGQPSQTVDQTSVSTVPMTSMSKFGRG